ncbi:hypothetical protein HZA57_03825 [Candidatus Poribacteria bacterium]|nr:hypothetical protein [Candidatus Poribacteria bacterium]
MKRTILTTAGILILPLSAAASFHLIHIEEVYTNSDGTIQFVELQCDAAGQTQLQNVEVVSQNADGTVTSPVFDFTSAFPALDLNLETVLLATSGAQTALGFSADFTIPDGSIPHPDGRVIFRSDGSTIWDAVAYGNFTGSNTGFGTPAAALPTDGDNSLQQVAATGNNSTSYAVGTNDPKRNDGTTGTLMGSSAVEDWMLY